MTTTTQVRQELAKEKYRYQISGYYFADNESKHFDFETEAEDNIQAMEMVIGKLAWKTSLENKTFELDIIHYECL